MKRVLRWLALAVVVGSMSSCGLPGAVLRSAGNLVNSVGGLAGAAAGT